MIKRLNIANVSKDLDLRLTWLMTCWSVWIALNSQGIILRMVAVSIVGTIIFMMRVKRNVNARKDLFMTNIWTV